MKTGQKSWKTQRGNLPESRAKRPRAENKREEEEDNPENNSIWVIGVLDRERKENNWESINKIIHKNFPDRKLMSFQIEKSQWARITGDEKTPALRHIAVQFQPLETKRRSYTCPKEKKKKPHTKEQESECFFFFLTPQWQYQKAESNGEVAKF